MGCVSLNFFSFPVYAVISRWPYLPPPPPLKQTLLIANILQWPKPLEGLGHYYPAQQTHNAHGDCLFPLWLLFLWMNQDPMVGWKIRTRRAESYGYSFQGHLPNSLRIRDSFVKTEAGVCFVDRTSFERRQTVHRSLSLVTVMSNTHPFQSRAADLCPACSHSPICAVKDQQAAAKR